MLNANRLDSNRMNAIATQLLTHIDRHVEGELTGCFAFSKVVFSLLNKHKAWVLHFQ